MNKQELRQDMLRINSSLSETELQRCDDAIYKAFVELPEYKNAKRIFMYVGVKPEVSTDAIMKKAFLDGKEVYVPLCYGKGMMDAVHISSAEELATGRYGIPEPPKENAKISPCKLELIIVPGVAFGEDGTRLGRGGGYYDRFLSSAVSAKKAALCREVNIKDTVPCEEHDECVDIIVSECRVIKI